MTFPCCALVVAGPPIPCALEMAADRLTQPGPETQARSHDPRACNHGTWRSYYPRLYAVPSFGNMALAEDTLVLGMEALDAWAMFYGAKQGLILFSVCAQLWGRCSGGGALGRPVAIAASVFAQGSRRRSTLGRFVGTRQVLGAASTVCAPWPRWCRCHLLDVVLLFAPGCGRGGRPPCPCYAPGRGGAAAALVPLCAVCAPLTKVLLHRVPLGMEPSAGGHGPGRMGCLFHGCPGERGEAFSGYRGGA